MLTQSLLPLPPKHLVPSGRFPLGGRLPPGENELIAVLQSAATSDPQPPGHMSAWQMAWADAPWRQPAAMKIGESSGAVYLRKQEINHKEINYNGPKEAPISTM